MVFLFVIRPTKPKPCVNLVTIHFSSSLYPAKLVTRRLTTVPISGTDSFKADFSDNSETTTESNISQVTTMQQLRNNVVTCYMLLSVVVFTVVRVTSNDIVTLLKSNLLQLIVTQKVICYCNFKVYVMFHLRFAVWMPQTDEKWGR